MNRRQLQTENWMMWDKLPKAEKGNRMTWSRLPKAEKGNRMTLGANGPLKLCNMAKGQAHSG